MVRTAANRMKEILGLDTEPVAVFLLPSGAERLPNPIGTAPGFSLSLGGCPLLHGAPDGIYGYGTRGMPGLWVDPA